MKRTSGIDCSPTTGANGPSVPLARQVASGPLLCAFGSALLLWMAFPPLGWWPLAWIAPCGWLRLVSQPHWSARRPYYLLYGAGLLHWLLLIQWIRLPHWSAYFGWLALAGYLAVYVPVFVGLTRVLVHRWGMTSCLAAPIVWTGLECARGYLLTGFSMSLLGHTQLPLLPLVQIASLVGAFGVSFLVMTVAACLERLWPAAGWRRVWLLPGGYALALVGGCWAYGVQELQRADPVQASAMSESPRRLRAALIQGSFDTQFDGDLERVDRAFYDYVRLSQRAVAQHERVDVVIWPESMFTGTRPMISYAEPLRPPADWEGTAEQYRERLNHYIAAVKSRIVWTATQLNVPLIVGMAWDHLVDGRTERFNSAVFISGDGDVLRRYDKTHLVMFGEYVPLGRWFPWLYRLTPMADGLTPGRAPQSFRVGDVRVAPVICFENTVPHLLRRHVRWLAQHGENPDVLVTVTNDGWFWGSSLLDVHLVCGVYRAIELHRPMLIAANTGFSAWIDAAGRVRAQGPRRAEAILVAEPFVTDPPMTVYLRYGDWFAGGCLLLATLAALVPCVQGRFALQIVRRLGRAVKT